MNKKVIKKQRNRQRGITLIALVITIVILIILATISINFIFNGGLIDRAEQARDYYQNDEAYTDESISNLTGYIDGLVNEIESGTEEETPESYVGYYADVDGNGSVDGIIYVDLADAERASGMWKDSTQGCYEYTPVTEGLKEYTISEENYTGFGGKWIRPIVTVTKESEG